MWTEFRRQQTFTMNLKDENVQKRTRIVPVLKAGSIKPKHDELALTSRGTETIITHFHQLLPDKS